MSHFWETNNAIALQDYNRTMTTIFREEQRYYQPLQMPKAEIMIEEEPDTRPVCDHCNHHADFEVHQTRTAQRNLYTEDVQEQVWYTCDLCGAASETLTKTVERKPVTNQESANPRRRKVG